MPACCRSTPADRRARPGFRRSTARSTSWSAFATRCAGTNFAARRSLIAGDVVVVGTAIADGFRTKEMPPGDVQAYNVRTGEEAVDLPHHPPRVRGGLRDLARTARPSTPATPTCGTGWRTIPELDYVYLPTSTPTHNEYGGNRPGDNLYAESLVCVDAKTGERIWHFQAVHHGVWDYDFAHAAHPGRHHRGRPPDQGGHPGQQAGVHVRVRPRDGRARLAHRGAARCRNRPCRASGRRRRSRSPPGRRRSIMQGTTEDNAARLHARAAARRALAQLQQFEYGPLFTPPSEKGTIFLPGAARRRQLGRGRLRSRKPPMLYVPSRTEARRCTGCCPATPGPDQPGLRPGPRARHPPSR